MARNRLLKREFFRDNKIGALSLMARLLFQSMWIQADDEGNGKADVQLLRSEAFMFDNFAFDEVEAALREIEKLNLVLLYEVGGDRYYSVRNFLKHQTINNPSKFRYPAPPSQNGSTSEVLGEHCGSPSVVLPHEVKSKGQSQRSTKKETETGKGECKGENLTCGADAPDGKDSLCSDLNDLNEPLTEDEDTRLFMLWPTITANKFKSALAFAKEDNPAFKRVVLCLYKKKQPRSPADRIALMGAVIDECKTRDVRYPEGWLKALTELRAENAVA